METKKQEAIRLAYGEYWEAVKNNLTDSNWFKSKEVLGDFANSTIRKKYPNIEWECMNNYHHTYCYYFRPKSLQGIENNNGWIFIESEEDLPKEKIYVYLIDKIKGFDEKPYTFNPNIDACKKELIRHASHYQPIQKPKNPIF